MFCRKNVTHQNKQENKILYTEAATRGVLSKKVFLEILQNLRKTPLPESLF